MSFYTCLGKDFSSRTLRVKAWRLSFWVCLRSSKVVSVVVVEGVNGIVINYGVREVVEGRERC